MQNGEPAVANSSFAMCHSEFCIPKLRVGRTSRRATVGLDKWSPRRKRKWRIKNSLFALRRTEFGLPAHSGPSGLSIGDCGLRIVDRQPGPIANPGVRRFESCPAILSPYATRTYGRSKVNSIQFSGSSSQCAPFQMGLIIPTVEVVLHSCGRSPRCTDHRCESRSSDG